MTTATTLPQTTSYSRVTSFTQCPAKWKYHYLDELEVMPDDDPANALNLGKALHKGIEMGSVEAGIEEYYSYYTNVTDLHVNEEIKLRHYIGKALEIVPDGLHEVDISHDEFKGFIDLLADNGDGTYDIWDYKYCNPKSIDRYKESAQLHVYVAMACQLGYKVRDTHYLIIPKVAPRQYKAGKSRKRDETLVEFRKRLRATLEEQELTVVSVPYEPEKVEAWEAEAELMLNATEYPKQPSRLCDWCDYKTLCTEGVDEMLLPSKARRATDCAKYKKAWLFGAPFTGKTTFANTFDDPIMLNTDGNVKYVDAPFVPIKNDVVVEGRMTKTTLAWQVFKDAIEELSKGSEFKTIVVDVLDDLYEHCRLYMYDKKNWEHESDDSFRAWDMVRTEFLSTIRRLTNLDYNIVLISHEDTSTDVTKKSGDKVTKIKPVLPDKIANKVAGMVDIVARVVVIDGEHLLSFKTDEVQFGGGRIKIDNPTAPLTLEALDEVYEQAGVISHAPAKATRKAKAKAEVEPVVEAEPQVEVEAEVEKPTEAPAEEQEAPKRRTRKSRSTN